MEGNGFLTFDMRLSKVLAVGIDKIVVIAKHPLIEDVKGELAIAGKEAKGSLEVPAGVGWVIIAEAYIGDIVYYRGRSTPIQVAAGQTVSVTITAQDLTPSITVLKPDGTDTADESFIIRWRDEDVDSNARISLFYDSDNAGRDGVAIPGAGALKEDNEKDVFPWDTRALPEGRYYVYAKIDDGVHPPKYAYSPGPLIVSHPKADLVAEEVFITWVGENEPIDPNSFVEGDEVDLSLRYRNAGTMDATEWRVEVYVDGILEAYDVVSTDANSAEREWFTWTATEGSHRVEFKLDTENVIRETDETNNSASLEFTVRPSGSEGGMIAGRSVEGVEIGFGKVRVIATLGNPDEVDQDWVSYDSGMDIWFGDDGRVRVIVVTSPYSGITERGIGLGSTASQIEEKYGPDYAVKTFEGFPTYWYGNLGIAFILNQSDICVSIAIFPPSRGMIAGRSVEGVEIGFGKVRVIATLGNPDDIDQDGDFTYDSGMDIWFGDDGRVEVILVTPPYSGITERSIGLGSPASQIEEKYGPDYAVKTFEGFPTYWYGNLGIAFILNQNDICVGIVIFAPSAAKAALSHTDTMERLQRYVSRAASEIKRTHTDLLSRSLR